MSQNKPKINRAEDLTPAIIREAAYWCCFGENPDGNYEPELESICTGCPLVHCCGIRWMDYLGDGGEGALLTPGLVEEIIEKVIEDKCDGLYLDFLKVKEAVDAGLS